MGACISKKKSLVTNYSNSLNDIDDSLPVKPKLISLILRVGTLIHRYQRKIRFGINNRNVSLAVELKMTEILLHEKLKNLQEAITGLKKISGKSKKISCKEKLESIEVNIKNTEKWINHFETTEKLTLEDKEAVALLQSYESIRKEIEIAQSDSKILDKLKILKH
jgi:cell fate (sporulation/competence/biofilm development) regulator YlbF (YheA/YmcA/DUF963 family)